jgi:hypothetical protein
MLQVDVFAVLFMNELKNSTNVVIGKLGKLVQKQNCSHDFFYFINHVIVIVQDTLLLKQKKLPVLDITGFFPLMSTHVLIFHLPFSLWQERNNSSATYVPT